MDIYNINSWTAATEKINDNNNHYSSNNNHIPPNSPSTHKNIK